MRRSNLGVWLVAGCILATRAQAQSSPIVDLLTRARTALNDLHYAEADSLAAAALAGFADRLTADQRIEALSLQAAAFYPDPTGGGSQRPDSAMVYLRRIVRADPAAARMRPEFSWAGLDSLFAVARQTTFAATARPVDGTGPHGEASVEVRATRRARFTLAMAPASGGATVAADSAGPGGGAQLRVGVLDGSRPLLTSGDYVLTVTATDSATGESVVTRLPATVAAPALNLEPVPSVLDPGRLLPETAPPARVRGVVAGLLLGGGAFLAASLKGPGPLAAATTDSRSIVMGGGMAVGAIIAGLLDRGRPLPQNAATNSKTRQEFAQSVQAARAENQRRLDAYRVTITIGPEDH